MILTRKQDLIEWILPYLIVEAFILARLAYNYLVELENLKLWLIYTTAQVSFFTLLSIWFVLKNGDKLADIGFKSENILSDVAQGLSYGIVIFVICFLMSGLAFAIAYTFVNFIFQVIALGPSLRMYYPPKYILFLYSLAISPFAEELYFRGYSLYKLEKSGIGKKTASFLQSLMFSLYYWRLGLIRGIIPAFIMALLLERVYIKRRSLTANLTARIVNNIIELFLFIYLKGTLFPLYY